MARDCWLLISASNMSRVPLKPERVLLSRVLKVESGVSRYSLSMKRMGFKSCAITFLISGEWVNSRAKSDPGRSASCRTMSASFFSKNKPASSILDLSSGSHFSRLRFKSIDSKCASRVARARLMCSGGSWFCGSFNICSTVFLISDWILSNSSKERIFNWLEPFLLPIAARDSASTNWSRSCPSVPVTFTSRSAPALTGNLISASARNFPRSTSARWLSFTSITFKRKTSPGLITS